MQNKPNFRKTEMSVNLFNTKNYEENGDSGHEKTNPIQTQFNPKQTQFNPISKPIQSQLKPILYHSRKLLVGAKSETLVK